MATSIVVGVKIHEEWWFNEGNSMHDEPEAAVQKARPPLPVAAKAVTAVKEPSPKRQRQGKGRGSGLMTKAGAMAKAAVAAAAVPKSQAAEMVPKVSSMCSLQYKLQERREDQYARSLDWVLALVLFAIIATTAILSWYYRKQRREDLLLPPFTPPTIPYPVSPAQPTLPMARPQQAGGEIHFNVAQKASRTVSTQSQVTYTWWTARPRFVPRKEREDGAWVMDK